MPQVAPKSVRAAAVAAAFAVVFAADPAAARSRPQYPLHTNVTATVFWIGEPKGNGSSEDNGVSTYDDRWQAHFGGFDDYAIVRTADNDYWPSFQPGENPFYLDLPFDDVNNRNAFKRRCQVIPWAWQHPRSRCGDASFSYMKNRWVKLRRGSRTCYGQNEDAGPYVYDDASYVFGTRDQRPRSKLASRAGLDVAPALRDCLGFDGLNNDTNKVSWQFVQARDVPPGPWRSIVTTRGVS
jgi:hypothetical protein